MKRRKIQRPKTRQRRHCLALPSDMLVGQSSNSQIVGAEIIPLLTPLYGGWRHLASCWGNKACGCRRRSLGVLTLGEAAAVLELWTHPMQGFRRELLCTLGKHLLPGTVLGAGKAAVDETHKNPCCPGVHILPGRQAMNHIMMWNTAY